MQKGFLLQQMQILGFDFWDLSIIIELCENKREKTQIYALNKKIGKQRTK